MSKIGRKPIPLEGLQVEIKNGEVHYKGKKASGVHVLPREIKASIDKNMLKLAPVKVNPRTKELWGLHRALLANELKGAEQGFEKQLRIVGLGFKAAAAGSKLQFSLGFSHKIDFEIPKGVAVEIDKSGQLLTFRSTDKALLGLVCGKIRSLRKPEPYKGTGIQYVNEVIIRKAGKAKSA
jgi:large subunit ribosomal protein L6